MNFTEMKVGSEYKLRNGELVKCVEVATFGDWPVTVEDFNKDQMHYTRDGKFYGKNEHTLDAVEEIPKKAPVLHLEVGKKCVFEDGKVGEVVCVAVDGIARVSFGNDYRYYYSNGKREYHSNPHGNAVKEFQSELPILPRHKNADLILEHARQKAEGELAAGWWVWRTNGKVAIVPETLSLTDKTTTYSYEKSDQHPDNANKIENKLKNVKIGSKITAKGNVFVVYYSAQMNYMAVNTTTNTATTAHYTTSALITEIKNFGEITEVEV